MSRAVASLALLVGLSGCPHDFSRAPRDLGPDAPADLAPPPDSARDAGVPDTWAPPDGHCFGDATRCGGYCVNLQTSAEHCGACGNPCAAGQDCVAGACACVPGGNCDGCCDGDDCLAPGSQSVSLCGQGGAACASCDDGQSCSTDACDGQGVCTHVPQAGYCLIEGTCYGDGAYKAGSTSCLQCQSATRPQAWTGLPNKGCVATVAGDGTKGLQNGAAGQAWFDRPFDVALDGTGGLLVADLDNEVIRIVAGGQVDTYAGTGAAPSTPINGALGVATFDGPIGLYRTAAELFVMDGRGNRIRQISNGVVSTIAGSSSSEGFQNGAALTALFARPTAAVVDATGAMYIADSHNHLIRKIEGGVVSTFAGVLSASGGATNGSTAIAEFRFPCDLVLSPDGALLVADSGNHAIRKIQYGQVSTLVGTGNGGYKDGPLSSAELHAPNGLAYDASGALLFADSGSNRIRRIAGGVVSTVAGNGATALTDGPHLSASFSQPMDLAVDATGKIYVADTFNHAIRVIVP